VESEQEYRLLFESNPQPMWVSDCDTLKFLAVNEAATRQYGYSREEFLSMTLLDFELEADVRRLPTAEQQRTPRLQRPERHKHKVKGGSLIDVETTSRNVFFGGRAAKLVLALDITERLRMEDQLCQSEEKFSKAFRSCPLAITITTLAEGRCLEVNDAFLRTFGHSRQDVIGRWAAYLIRNPRGRARFSCSPSGSNWGEWSAFWPSPTMSPNPRG
jgi:PAS domain S-box-containing protein